jgi:hypothetical protein
MEHNQNPRIDDADQRCQAPSTATSPAMATRVPGTNRDLRDRGQATTEYALVLLAAALVGLLVVGWATSGGGAAAVGKLFENVIDSVIDKT